MDTHERLILNVAIVMRQRRQALNMSQHELASKSDLHRSYIGDLERGARNIALKNLSKLALALGMSPSKVMAMAEKKTTEKGGVHKERKNSL